MGLGPFKGSSDPSHFILEINVVKGRIRHRTTLNFIRFESRFNVRFVLCRIRLFPTLDSRIKWLGSELPLQLNQRGFFVEPFPDGSSSNNFLISSISPFWISVGIEFSFSSTFWNEIFFALTDFRFNFRKWQPKIDKEILIKIWELILKWTFRIQNQINKKLIRLSNWNYFSI